MTEQKKQNNNKKKSLSKPKLSLWLISALGIVVILYCLIGFTYQKVFFPATIVNGVNISGLNLQQAQEALNSAVREYILTLEEEEENTEQISGSSIGLYMVDDGSLGAILDSQNMLTWGFEVFHDKEYFLAVDYDKEKLHTAIEHLSCMEKNKWAAPENAYISYEKGGGYRIIPEVAGNEILTEKFFDAAAEAVCSLDGTLSLKEAGLYKLPAISSEDPALQERLALLQSYSDMTVTYQFGDQKEILDGDTLSEWISVSKSGKRTIDREAVAQYVKELAGKYNTAYSAKTLETSYGETITIKNGYYGWMIDKEAETDNLMKIIREGKSVVTEPAYLMEAASHDGPDYGDTYVEINLTAQHLFYYKDGELIIESDFVSGNPARGNDTPSGAYCLTYKERNATLRGQNYATPVSYWMPFNGNIGMHDSSWRSTFGGSIYKTNGSHGCINLPPSVAKTIYENIEQGIPVLCYHLSGTEQAYATNLSGDKVSGQPVVPELEPEVPLLPENGILPSDTQIPPEGGIVIPDGQILPEAGMVIPDGQALPEAGAAVPDGQILPEAGTMIPDGQALPEAGQ